MSALLSFVSRDKRRKRSLCDDLCCLDQRGEVGYALCLFQCTDLFVRMWRWPPQPVPVLGIPGPLTSCGMQKHCEVPCSGGVEEQV